MPKPESFPIDKIYVPVKSKKALKPELVQEIAQSILEIGQQAPILVRTDEDRFVLVEGLHRLEACKALGEETINCFNGSRGDGISRASAKTPGEGHPEQSQGNAEPIK